MRIKSLKIRPRRLKGQVLRGKDLEDFIEKLIRSLSSLEKEKFLSGWAFIRATFLKDSLSAYYFPEIKEGGISAFPKEIPEEYKRGDMGLSFLKEAEKAMFKITVPIAKYFLNLPESEIFFEKTSHYLVEKGSIEKPILLKSFSPQWGFWPLNSILTKKFIAEKICWAKISETITECPLGNIYHINREKFKELSDRISRKAIVQLVENEDPWVSITKHLIEKGYIDEYLRPIKSLSEITAYLKKFVLPSRECPICGKIYKIDRKTRITCGSSACRMKKKRLKDWAKRILKIAPKISAKELAFELRQIELEMKRKNRSPKKVHNIDEIAKILLKELRSQ